KGLGFVGMYLLIRVSVRVRTSLALLGAALFTLSNASYLAAGHSQLLAVGLAPFVWLLGWCYAGGGPRPGPGMLCASAAMAALLLLTAYYIGWFTVFVSLVAAAVAGLAAVASDGAGAWSRLRAGASRHRAAAARAAAVFALGVVPLLVIYLPVRH